nr:MAG TPA: large terminase protein [Caudoviricetes sp.]
MAKKEIDTSHLNAQQFRELVQVQKDVFYFSTFAYVVHPVRGKTRFLLYPYQKSVLYCFLKHRFNIILKFRQAGITELISLYCLWLTMYHPNKKVNIISIKDSVAKKVLKKIKYMYKNLPEHLKVPIINGRMGELGTACITGDTMILGTKTDFPIQSIAPSEKGYLDVSGLNIRVLTENGTFERIMKTFNKGKLKTYTIVNDRGLTLRCTPKHKLLTTKGWKTVGEILKNNLTVIFKDTKELVNLAPPKVEKPVTEEIRETNIPGYWVSNLGRVFTTKTKKGKGHGRDGINPYGTELRVMVTMVNRHERVKLTYKGSRQVYSVHRLVWEAFKGPIPEGMIIDHINGNGCCNWITNLQVITYSENTRRAFTMNRVLKQSVHQTETLSYKQIGRVKELLKRDKYLNREIAKRVSGGDKDLLDQKKVSRISRGKNCSDIYISKIAKVDTTLETIYDMEVENYHSYITTNGYINHNSMIEFINGSFIESIPTSEEAGRSESLSLLVIDEAAIVRWASTIWAAAAPAISTGGSAILNSTPYGISGFYHSKWVEAITDSDSPFHPIRLYWKMHPERDQKWYDTMSKALGPRRTAQEIDGDFLSSGSTVFDLTDIKAIEDTLSEYPVIETRFNGQLRIMDKPKQSVRYFIGADVATGRSNDYSAFTLGDSNGEEAAVFKGRIPVEKYAKILGNLGKEFNWATIAPETNDIGLAVTTLLQTEGYPQLYYHKKLLKKKGKSRPEVEQYPGWITTSKNRSLIIDGLEEDIRKDNITIKDPFFVQEAYTFIYDSIGRPVAMGKHNRNNQTSDIDMDGETYSDDSIFGKAIYNHVRKNYKPSLIIQPK